MEVSSDRPQPLVTFKVAGCDLDRVWEFLDDKVEYVLFRDSTGQAVFLVHGAKGGLVVSGKKAMKPEEYFESLATTWTDPVVKVLACHSADYAGGTTKRGTKLEAYFPVPAEASLRPGRVRGDYAPDELVEVHVETDWITREEEFRAVLYTEDPNPELKRFVESTNLFMKLAEVQFSKTKLGLPVEGMSGVWARVEHSPYPLCKRCRTRRSSVSKCVELDNDYLCTRCVDVVHALPADHPFWKQPGVTRKDGGDK